MKKWWVVVTYLIIPGIGGSGDAHWQTLWEAQWGADAVRIAPSSWSAPDLHDWVAAIERAAQTPALRDTELVLIAHSLGCWAAAAWLAGTTGGRVGAALLVAPPDPAGSAFPADAAASFVGVEAQTLPCPSMVIASANDPYSTFTNAEALAAAWGSDLRVVGALGHLNAASGIGAWSQGRRLLDGLLASTSISTSTSARA